MADIIVKLNSKIDNLEKKIDVLESGQGQAETQRLNAEEDKQIGSWFL